MRKAAYHAVDEVAARRYFTHSDAVSRYQVMNTLAMPAGKVSGKATYKDVLDAPPHMTAEVLAGKLHTHPRPAARHAWASSALGIEVGSPFSRGRGGPRGWWIIDEPELHFGSGGEDIAVPDLAGWRRETMPEYPDAAYFDIAPDWVCEILSPSTMRIDRHEKAEIYARERVSHMWFVDPGVQMLEAFELRGGRWTLLATLADDAPVSLPPFDAVTFPLDALWPESAGGGNRTAEKNSANDAR